MSQQNAEIVRRVYAEWAQGNMWAGVELFDPEIVFESFMPDANERIVANGPEEVEAHMREALAQFRDFRLIGEEFRAVESTTVLVTGRQAARGRQSGVEVEQPLFSVWRFRGEKVIGLRFTPIREEALEAAGLSE